jgi:hypothetical protein
MAERLSAPRTLDRASRLSVPHFDVATTEGERVRYAELWQRRNLVFVSSDVSVQLPEYAERLLDKRSDFARADAALVVAVRTGGRHAVRASSSRIVGEIIHVFPPDAADIDAVSERPSGLDCLRAHAMS